ncbi:hypothetical protein INR49_009411 [Caranx melampygus]|nr:hypothetical protein INR49_009411 [Caranx melampygus]
MATPTRCFLRCQEMTSPVRRSYTETQSLMHLSTSYKHITLGCCIAIGNRRHSWCFSQRGGDEEEEEDSAPQQQQQTSCDWQKDL